MSTEMGIFFNWFQIVGLALFLGLFLGRTLHLTRRKHIRPITLSVGKKGVLGALELGLFLQVNVWVLVVLMHALPLDIQLPPWLVGPKLVDSLPWKLLGTAIVVFSFLIAILALAALGDSWRLGLDERNPGRLVTHGIYSLSRNPIYAFFDLYFAGTFLINGSAVFLLLTALTVVNLHYQILQEEQSLSRIHGSAYAEYCATTPRYLTWRKRPQLAQPEADLD